MHNAATPRRALTLAALLALALFQVSYAGHQFQHQGGDRLEVCGICMQLERLDDALAPTEPVALVAPTWSRPEPLPDNLAVPSPAAAAYRSRAPPLV